MRPSVETTTNRGEVSLRREINLLQSVSIVIGSIIGSGIFVSPSIVLLYSGSIGLSLVLWALGGIISMAGGLCYCELGTRIPNSGSEYAYVREAFSFKHKKPWMTHLGSLLAFLLAWISVIVTRAASLSIMTLTFAEYVLAPFFVHCDNLPVIPVKLIALAIIILIAAINCFNISLGAYMQVVLSALKILACAFIIIVGIWQAVTRDCLSYGLRHPWAGTTSSPGNIVLALYAVLWAYDGWNSLSYSSEEQKDINKNLSYAVLIGVPVVTVCYLLVNMSIFFVLTPREIISADTVAMKWASQVLGTAGLVIIPVVIAISIFGAAHISMYSAVRQNFAAARAGHLPRVLSGIHKQYRTPVPSIILQAVLSGIMCVVGNIGSLIDSFNASVWLFYGLTFASLLIMRVTHKEEKIHYKVWLPVPIFMLCASVLLVLLPIYQSPVQSAVAFAGILSGVPVYFIFVMETPRKLRPKILDRMSAFATTHVSQLLNTVPCS